MGKGSGGKGVFPVQRYCGAAAQAVGVIPARIAKTLSFLEKDGERALLLVAAGDARIDNPKYKHTFGCKAKMLSAGQVRSLRDTP